jgi:poly-gamma-glutamate capsule biosynthesis protein CapA/YwtB (metallophosphatase superfamily)
VADGIVKLLCLLEAARRGREFRASRPVEGNAAYMDRAEGLWWAYKFYFGPVEEPEPGSGLEELFRGQDLDFSRLPAGLEDFVEESSVTLGAAGDILVSPDLGPATLHALWDETGSFLFGADLAFANLETPVAPSCPPGFLPRSILGSMALNSSPEAFDAIRGGFALFSTANNHCLDQGEAGLRETLDFLDGRGCAHVGTARSPEERDAVVLIERRGVKVAFLSWTFALNWKSLPEGREYLANHLRLNLPGVDLSPIAAQAAAARAAGADAVVACLHWSLEFESWPTRSLVETAHRLVELGIDVIIGNHPHGIQPIERHSYRDRATGEPREGLILYALGDLVTVRDRVLPNSHLGLLARVRISKGRTDGSPRARISGLELLPTYLFPGMRKGRCADFRILDLAKLAEELRSGGRGPGLSARQARDVPRLESLARRLAGPALRPGPGREGGRGAAIL